MKNKIRIYHRASSEELIISTPDGKLFRTIVTTNVYKNKTTGPCYYFQYKSAYYRCNKSGCYAKFRTQKEAIKAMFEYDKDVALVGEL